MNKLTAIKNFAAAAIGMSGWKTWLAALSMAGLGIVRIADGEVETGVSQIAAALALIGIGHKIEKAEGNISEKKEQS